MKSIIILLIIIGVLTIPFTALALSLNPLNTQFGGRITLVAPCICSPGTLMIKAGPPKGGTFIYVPFVSTLYKFRVLIPGVWSLGLASGRRTCYIPAPKPPYCSPGIPIGSGPIIRKIGTSLF